MSQRRLPSLVGFDDAIVRSLDDQNQRRLRRLLRWYPLPCAAMGLSGGLFVWLVEHSLIASTVLAVAIALMVLNLLRLIVAGGGAAPHWSEGRVSRWAPTLPPLLILGGLAACFAQPIQLAVFAPLVDRAVQEHRAELVSRHPGARDEVPGLSSVDEYRRQLDRCYFATYRLARLWKRPERPLLFTFLFCAIALAPILMGHTTHLRALRAYELSRWRAVQELVRASERAHQADVCAALEAFQLFVPDTLPKIAQAPRSTTGAHHG